MHFGSRDEGPGPRWIELDYQDYVPFPFPTFPFPQCFRESES